MADEGIQGLGKLLSRIGQMATDTKRVERPLKAAGVYIVGSINKNFQQQGRPKRWTPLAPGTLAARRKGKGRGGPKILIDKATMKNQVAFKVHSKGVEAGLNAVQARRLHFGYPGGSGPGHSKTPARPFVMLQQPEDIDYIGDKIFRNHIARK